MPFKYLTIFETVKFGIICLISSHSVYLSTVLQYCTFYNVCI